MYCRKCGAKLSDDTAFCPKCGTQVADDAGTGPKEEKEEAPAKAPPKEKPATRVTPEEEKEPLLFPPKDPDPDEADAEKQVSPPAESEPKSDPVAESRSQAAESPADDPAPAPASSPGEPSSLPADLLPKPDGIARENQHAEVNQERVKKEKKTRKSKKRRHPKDAYENLKERISLRGCLLMALFVILVPAGILGYLGYREYDHFVNEERFTSVFQKDPNVVDAPLEDTFYWGLNVLYEAGETDREIAIVGGTWYLKGTFREKVYFRGYQLVLEKGAHFLKGIDVKAVRLNAGDARIDGEFSGSVMFQTEDSD